jgi:hypothetical protein
MTFSVINTYYVVCAKCHVIHKAQTDNVYNRINIKCLTLAYSRYQRYEINRNEQ